MSSALGVADEGNLVVAGVVANEVNLSGQIVVPLLLPAEFPVVFIFFGVHFCMFAAEGATSIISKPHVVAFVG